MEKLAKVLEVAPYAKNQPPFMDPDITTKFWFSKSSGRLEEGKQIRWDWEAVGHALVNVKTVEQDKRILIEWGAEQEKPTTVEWLFTSQANDETIVSVTNSGFRGDGDQADRLFNALSEGGEIEMPIADQAWGDYYGSCKDKFGVQWMVNYSPQ